MIVSRSQIQAELHRKAEERKQMADWERLQAYAFGQIFAVLKNMMLASNQPDLQSAIDWYRDGLDDVEDLLAMSTTTPPVPQIAGLQALIHSYRVAVDAIEAQFVVATTKSMV